MESQAVVLESPELDHLLDTTTFRIHMLMMPKRIKKHTVFTDTNYRSFFEVRIIFSYKTLSHNAAASEPNHKISQRLLGRFLKNCKYLRSSTNRTRLYSLIDVAKEQARAVEFNFGFLEAYEKLVKLQSKIFREEEYRHTSAIEASMKADISRYLKDLIENLYYTAPSPEVMAQMFDLLAHSYTEEQVLDHWRKALIRSVLGS